MKLDDPNHSGKVGPNSIIRVAEALRALASAEIERQILLEAGLEAYLVKMPEQMVDEREVTRLQRVVWAELDEVLARRVFADAGRRTGDYLLARRIPGPVQTILKLLPPALASRMLLSAIRRNAWTFSGSGHLTAESGKPVRLALTDCPLCRDATSAKPICDYYAATFERLFRELVATQARVEETQCQALGAPACVFEVRW